MEGEIIVNSVNSTVLSHGPKLWDHNHKAISTINYGGPKGSITNRFTKTQNNFPKHKTISQNTKQFPKAQISFPKHKSISQNTNQFLKTRTSLPKHKPISQNTNQFRETQINGLGTFPVIIRESLERTHSQDFPRPTW